MTITVGFRVIYVFVVVEVGTRRIVHWNVTAQSTAEWTIQQFRAAIAGEAAHRFLVDDRDAIYASTVDRRRVDGAAGAEDAREDAASERVL